MLRYRMTRADGKRLECREFVGLVRDFPNEKAARREIERSGLVAHINAQEADTRIRFHALALHYLNTIAGRTRFVPRRNAPSLTLHISPTHTLSRNGERLSRTISNPSIYSIGSKSSRREGTGMDDDQ